MPGDQRRAGWPCSSSGMSGSSGRGDVARRRGRAPRGASRITSRNSCSSSRAALGAVQRPGRRGPPARPGAARNSSAVTTPKLPPPPRSAQSRSGFSSADARTSSPSAVTSSAASRLSQARPCLRSSQPEPPPSVSPATPVVETRPPVVARPCACVARSTCGPGGAAADARDPRAPGRPRRRSSRARRARGRRRTSDRPVTEWPPPRTATASPCVAGEARAPRSTSSGAAQRAT